MKQNKKLLLLSFLLFSPFLTLFSNEIKIAENYIKKSFQQIEKNKKLADYFLDQSFEYSRKLPEYYFLKNRLLNNRRVNMYLKKENAENIVLYLHNSFLIYNYTLLKETIAIFEKTHAYEKCIGLYTILLDYHDRELYDDYIKYIKLLIAAEEYGLIIRITENALERYYTLDLIYYNLLAKLKTDSASLTDYREIYSRLKSNGYPAARLLYLKSIFTDSSSQLASMLDEYSGYLDKNQLNPGFKKIILYEFYHKKHFLDLEHKEKLFSYWIEANGLSDYRTGIIIKDAYFSPDNTGDIAPQFLLYTGIRTKDIDNDGLWEEMYQYRDGKLRESVIDSNQDGIYENRTEYYFSGSIKHIYKYNKPDEYYQYRYNERDNSLEFIEKRRENRTIEKITLKSSSFFQEGTSPPAPGSLLKYIDHIEYYPSGKIFKKFHNGIVQHIYFDSDNDGFFEYKQFFHQGLLIEGLRDTSGDRFYDTMEKYSGGSLKNIFTKTNPSYSSYDYKEEITESGIIKYWDENRDNLYEIAVEEKGNIINKKFDINFDGKYEYIYQTIKNKSENLYRIENGKWIMLESHSKGIIQTGKGWVIVTAAEPDTMELPDKILIQDNKNTHGIFRYQNEKYFFKFGVIETGKFKYKIFRINNTLYLFDIMR